MANQQYSTFLPSGALDLARPPNLRHYSDSMVSPRGLAPRTSAINRTVSPSFISGSQRSCSNSNHISPLTSPPARHASSPFASHLHQSRSLASPPISRSGSSDSGATAALIEDWRSFTRKLRDQFATEKKQMNESRLHSEEVMADERALWDKERTCYEARIAELEAQLLAFTGHASTPSNQQANASYFPSLLSRSPQNISLPKSTHSYSGVSTSGARSVDSSASKGNSIASHVPQESGKKADGSFFYAPVSQPTRTFDPSPSSEVRVDSLHVIGETPLHITSKELTAADFLSPPSTESNGSGIVSPNKDSRSGSVVGGDSIDISLIAPGLEGVPIRRDAVEPTFVAHIMSPLTASTDPSPNKLSPDLQPPRPVQNYDLSSPEAKRRGSQGSLNFERRVSAGSLGSGKGSPKRGGPKKTFEIIKQPHEKRLTMHAGHTPNHSVIHFELGDSGLTTPKASKINKEMEIELGNEPREDVHVLPEGQTCVEDRLREFKESSGDYELTGPLGLKNEAAEDDIFLKALTTKLEEVKEREADEVSIATTETSDESNEMHDQDVLKQALHAIGRSMGSSSIRGGDGMDDDMLDNVPDDVPILRLKPSVNFGRPMGSL